MRAFCLVRILEVLLASINRYQAFGFHLLGSALVASCGAGLIFLLWYPGLLAYASGVEKIFLLLVSVDVVVGPLITLIIFDKNKKELKRDLFTVLIIQVAALLYGLWVMFSARPVFVVFNSDRFDVVYANELTGERYEKAAYDNFKFPPLWGPVYVGARLPTDAERASSIINSAIAGGDDVQQFPEFYVPYSEMVNDISSLSKPLGDLRQYNKQNASQVDGLINQYSSISDKIGYVPLKARVKNLTVIVDKSTSVILEMNKLQPFDNSFGVNAIDLQQLLKNK